MNNKKLWKFQKDNLDNFLWKLENSVDVLKRKIIKLDCDGVDWVEKYIYRGSEIKKIHCFDKGSILIPVDEEFNINIFNKGFHHFSIYDLDGKYTFIGGYNEFDPNKDELIDCYGNDIFDLLDYEGTVSSVITLSNIKVGTSDA